MKDGGLQAVLVVDPTGNAPGGVAMSAELSPPGNDLLGHPRGLIILAGTELWDRISFHGMLALLVLYMVGQLLLPGHIERIVGFAELRSGIEAITGPLSIQALATQIFGLYVGLIYFTPVFGGLLGDRLLGRRRTVILGALLMSVGHFCMAFEQSFLLALFLLIAGAGCLRGNLGSQLGDLYAKDDRRRDDGFQIYMAMVNTGFFIAPIITGALAQIYNWHWGFAFAGFGMLVGLVVYTSGYRLLPPDPPRAALRAHVRLGVEERRTVLVLCLMLPLLTLFWIAQSQCWNTYNLWARDQLDLLVGRWMVPVPWLQSVDGLMAVVLVPPLIVLWRWQARRGMEPDDIAKLGIGCIIFGGALAWLSAAGPIFGAVGKVPLAWDFAYHCISGIGYLFVAPIALALFSRAAPPAVNAMMVGVYYLSIFAGSTISGRLGGLYERLSPSRFWLLHAAIVAAGGVLTLLLAPQLRRSLLHETARPACLSGAL